MLRFVLIIVALLGLPAPLVASKGLCSYAEGKQFYVGISNEDLLKTPAWKDHEENPPLSARKAINLATELQKTFVKDSKGHKWEFVTADLYPDSNVDRWYWEVTFMAYVRPREPTLRKENLIVIVLMDVKVLKPEVRPYPR